MLTPEQREDLVRHLGFEMLDHPSLSQIRWVGSDGKRRGMRPALDPEIKMWRLIIANLNVPVLPPSGEEPTDAVVLQFPEVNDDAPSV